MKKLLKSIILELLEELARDERILSKSVGYEEKARILTDLNETRGYMMIRIFDSEWNVYKEGIGWPLIWPAGITFRRW